MAASDASFGTELPRDVWASWCAFGLGLATLGAALLTKAIA